MAQLLNINNLHIIEEKNATAIVVKLPNGQYRLGDEKDIIVGKPINLLLPSGIVVTTSPVQEWRKYGSFFVTTKNSQYFIAYEG